ncbi:MAG: M6 family metalloprotease domain-containing protein [Spirochaetales bacterium]|nr:M6 family metalloprotease domain-containing protein [Spirochaetales bacterium]
MNKLTLSRYSILLFTLIFTILSNTLLVAAPHEGEIFHFPQPDGTSVTVKIWGDEHYQIAEGLDGYTLVKDPANGWICYADVSDDEREYVSTGIHYTLHDLVPEEESGISPREIDSSRAADLKKHLRILPDSVRQNADAVYAELNQEPVAGNFVSEAAEMAAPAELDVTGNITGLTILVDFPDVSSSISRDEIINLLNQEGYSNYSNNGSVKDYFHDVSAGKLTYENRVTSFITMNNAKNYYDNGDDYTGARVLIYETLDKLRNLGFDFTEISTGNGEYTAINLMYAGEPEAGWGNGLWPHKGTLDGSYTINDIQVRGYQMSNIGTELSIGTFCHENGHLLCKWKDLYAYDNHDYGVGTYCIMSYNDKKNPQTPNPYFRWLAGWIDYTEIAGSAQGTVFTATANSNEVFRYYTGGQEFFLIEARTRTGRSTVLPDEGLLIWHINSEGSNLYESYPNMVSVEQADGKNELENRMNKGGTGDLFHAGYNDRFNDTTQPDAQYLSGSNSGLDIAAISDTSVTMTFTFGEGTGYTPDPTPGTTPEPTPTGGSQTGDIKLQYRCADINVSTNQIKPHITILNTGDSAVPMNQLTVRYYYTREGSGEEEFHVDYSGIGTGNISGSFQNGFLEVSFSSGAGTLSPGAQTGEIQLRINKTDWSSYDQSDDYSFDASYSDFLDYTRITLYLNGILTWGTEPGGTEITPSPYSTSAPTPEPTGISTPEPTPGVLPGDVNSDGLIDILDALVVAQFYVGFDPPDFNPDAADVNCDDVIDILDALLIARYYVGLIEGFC